MGRGELRTVKGKLLRKGKSMGRSGLDDFGAYRDALDLFDMVVEDMRQLRRTAHCYRLSGLE